MDNFNKGFWSVGYGVYKDNPESFASASAGLSDADRHEFVLGYLEGALEHWTDTLKAKLKTFTPEKRLAAMNAIDSVLLALFLKGL